ELPFGGIRQAPGGADTARARTRVAGRTTVGSAAVLAAPSNLRPATCWWLRIRRAVYGGGGARPHRDTGTLLSGAPVRRRLRGHEVWVLWGHVGSRFESIDVRFQDGAAKRLRVNDGYFLYLVPLERRQTGRRPTIVSGRNPSGRVGRRQLLFPFTWAP